MTICCHTEITKPWSSEELDKKLALLPASIKEAILRKRQHHDIQLSVSGKLLLLHLLHRFNLLLSLTNMEYDDYHRPFFYADFDFNISHSGNMVICCGTTNGKVGADIEQIHPVDFGDFTDCFRDNEWNNILISREKADSFFRFWSRKEAVLKAAGTGLYTPLLDIDVTVNEVKYNDHIYYLSPLNIFNGYQCHIAQTVKQNISVERITL
jgi:4'-phosphopantetheinyl transferase